ncbi:hypothetical protein OS493_036591 [Desmophyllum pertusum]|uniref:Cartilage intermediate layer protein 1/2 domain-containing protein n=1 Tax=Desmophyllum pertusum TaxID=174260 RepID=A0A9W9ZW75_9CNID|nr:hypothetical protein OS493_036591 [Desmophyllum pertusum]
MASVTTTCKTCNDLSLLMSSSLNESPSLSSMSYDSIDTGLGSLSSMVLSSSSLNESPSLSSMSYDSIDTGLGSLSSMVLSSSSLNESPSLSSMSYDSIDTGLGSLSSMVLSSSSLNESPSLSSMSYDSIDTGLGSLSSMVLSSSLNESPSLSSMSYSIDTGLGSLSSMVLSSSLNERPSLSSMSYSIDPHTTTGPASSLSSMAKLVPNAEAKWSRWSSWSDCTKTCGNGTRFRTRTCVAQNQRAVFAPISCAGKHQQNKTCADWGCPDCSKICVRGTLNVGCDACTCEDHVLTGRVQTKNNAPLADAKISLVETPYNVLAQTNASGFFIAFNVCVKANQELLISREGFVPVKIKATITTSTTASVKAKLENAVPPSITVHPRSKMRISGHGVTFCCDGDGNPTQNLNDTSDEVSCNPTPISKNATLPEGCVIHGTTNDIVDVGQCPPMPCLRKRLRPIKYGVSG